MLDVNEYFDGKVKSIAFQTATLPATVGVMAPGKYEFTTSEKETMTILNGSLTVMLPGSEAWMIYEANTSFEVAAGETFKVEADADTAYLCAYG